MPIAQNKAVVSYRRRMKLEGWVRVEVQVRKEDAPLLREVAGALTDPDRAAEARALLRDRLGSRATRGLKALLAAAPLAGIDLRRRRDKGRPIKL